MLLFHIASIGGYAMNSIDLTPLYRSSIGFDRYASLLDNTLSSESFTGFPAYDIEMMDDDRYTITLAVSGFEQDDLDIEVEKDILTVKGQVDDKKDRQFLYQGIARQSFEKKFNLAEYIRVENAAYSNGLLTINLVKEVPEEMRPKSIPINQTSQKQIEHNKSSKAA